MSKQRSLLAVLILAGIVSITAQSNAQSVMDDASFEPRGSKDFDEAVLRYLRNEAPKIVGGVMADPGEFPWQVSLVVSWIADPARGHFCGGSIYDSRWIVTAAHCLDNLNPFDINVVAGTNVLSTGAPRFNVVRTIMHKSYDAATNDNDIALLEVRDGLPLSATMKPISPATEAAEQALKPGTNLVVTGWGATVQGGTKVADLRKVDVPFVTNKDCNDILSYDGKITKNMLCAGKAVGGVDSCQGDSGGPLVLRDGDTPLLVGVVSWGEGCAKPGKYGVYANVPVFESWIKACVENPAGCQ